MRKSVVKVMRLLSAILITFIIGGVIGSVFSISPVIPCVIVGIASTLPLMPVGSLGVLLGSFTGAVSYTGSIDAPVARILIDGTSATAVATFLAAKLTLSKATPRKTGTMIPEISLDVLSEIAGFLDALRLMTSTDQLTFSLPVSLTGAYDPEGGSITYTLSGCTAGDTINVYSIDDQRKGLDYIEITPVACQALGAKQIDVRDVKLIFVDPTILTRVKFTYANIPPVEFVGAEIEEIARIKNPVHSLTAAGALTAGYVTVAGIDVISAVSVELTFTGNTVVYLFKHLLAG